ncbi:DUF2784 domain-containing protein [Gimesia fumaroli]|uniref:DUF2784 domain-containing protein n=1 Tax=Gimesia fumaroli TaxID=2527976 RepID=A0A518ICI7_9PLAN|nr:DUF2784 domain-containing protein [Gimesia fumaroli]QDV50750.1 hypothetical protein Enr17x_27930 [Gimesia fumaroli]
MNFHDTQFLYRVGADTTVVIHFAFVMFVLLGQILITLGVFSGWNWVRNFKFRVIHLISILFVVAESLTGVICPLTTLEKWLREKAGQASYQGDFIATWVHDALFMEAEPWVFTLCYSLFGLLVLITFFFAPPRRKPVQTPEKEV